MAREISEADWKLLRRLHPIALDRFCERVLSELTSLASAPGQTSHPRWSAVSELVERRNREMADIFDDLRRSTAFVRLAHLRGHGLLTDEELAQLSPETRSVLELFFGARHA